MTTGESEAEAARSELARLQQLRLVVKLAGLGWFFLLGAVGFIVLVTIHSILVGLTLMVLGIMGRFAAGAFDTYLSVRMPKLSYESEGGQRWWYDRRSGNVEEGIMPHGKHRDGPYRSRDDALRGPEIARERAAAWNAEDD
jgi:hypothetical protein